MADITKKKDRLKVLEQAKINLQKAFVPFTDILGAEHRNSIQYRTLEFVEIDILNVLGRVDRLINDEKGGK